MSAQLPFQAAMYRFGVFELNATSMQLLRNGHEVHLQGQPFRLLLYLLGKRGEICTREELQEKLWPAQTFVEFDDGLNTAIQKVRQVLGDDARNPRFVETVPRRGYRFIAPVHVDAPVPEAPPISAEAVALGAPAKPERWTWPWITAAAALFAFAAGWLLAPGRLNSAHPVRPLKLVITPPDGVDLRPGIRGGSAISPDGRTAAFIGVRGGKQMLWIRSLETGETHELPGTADAILPFWSPDGKSLGFVATGKLRTFTLPAGPVQEWTEATRPTRGTWTSDGGILFSGGAGAPMFRVKAAGEKRMMAAEPGARWPSMLSGRDANRFFYYSTAARGVKLGDRIVIPEAESNAIYAPPLNGHPAYLLWLRSGTLMAQAFEAGLGALSGPVLPVTEGVGLADRWRLADVTASVNGVLLFGAGNSTQSRLTWVRRDGSVLQHITTPDVFGVFRVSPDGRRVAAGRGRSRFIWTLSLDSNTQTRITFEPHASGWPVWSPDGRQIAYSQERVGSVMNLMRRDAAGAKAEEKIQTSPLAQFLYDWSRDGRWAIYCEVSPETRLDLWALPLTGPNRTARPVLNTTANEDLPQFSPDSRWISYVSDETGRNEVYVMPFPPSGAKWQVSTQGGTMPHWRGDGAELYFVAADGTVMATRTAFSGAAFRWTAPQPLFNMPIAGASYDVAPAGDRFLILTPESPARLNELTVLVNWQAGLGRD